MLSLRKPTPAIIDRFLAEQATLPFTYPEVGATAGNPPRGYNFDARAVELGHGEAAWLQACEGLRAWAMVPREMVELYPNRPDVVAGGMAGILIRSGGLWALNSARIVYVIEPTTERRAFGFAYGTLPGHMERGEEQFLIEWRPDGSVWYRISAFSLPRHVLAWASYPYVRFMQKRFGRRSLVAMQRHMALSSTPA